MKLSRKLIPAMIMLLVSAVLMSTASFAWFSTNSMAEANGMKIKVAAAQTLLIKEKDSKDAFATSVGLKANMDKVSPVSADPSKTPSFWKLESAGTKMNPDSYAAGDDASFALDSTAANYIKKSVILRATGDPLDDIKVSITVSDNSESPIDPALRVMLVYGDTVLYYAPVDGYKLQPAVVNYDKGALELAKNAPSVANKTGEFIIENITANTEYQVDIYVWYEGQDENCKANNAISIGDLSPVINFTLDSKPASGQQEPGNQG